MKLGKKGQRLFVGIMMFVVAVIVIVQLISPIKDQITTSRDNSNLDCDNSSITTMNKATCVVMDTTLFYFVGMALAAAGAFLGGKMIYDKVTQS